MIVRKTASFLVGFSLIVGAFGPAWAETVDTKAQSDPLVAYRAYTQAIKEGKVVEAAEQAQIAWQKAELAWGKTANTAGLAFNAAWSLALIGKAKEGLPAAKRAVELASLAGESFMATEAQFMLANAEFDAANLDTRSRKAEALDSAAKAVEGSWGDMLVADSLVKASINLSSSGKSRKGAELAERSFAEVQRINPNDQDRLAMVNLARAISKLSFRDKLPSAYEDIVSARLAYGKSRSANDKTWGMLSAWQLVVHGIMHATGNTMSNTGSRIENRDPKFQELTDEHVAKIFTEVPECKEFSRLKRRRIGQDIQPMRVGNFSINLGGVHVLTDLTPDGRVINPRVIGVVPDASYADASLKGISTWQYEIPANVPAQCLKDYDITVVFTMN
jgi:hypothetical protein